MTYDYEFFLHIFEVASRTFEVQIALIIDFSHFSEDQHGYIVTVAGNRIHKGTLNKENVVKNTLQYLHKTYGRLS